MPYPDKAHKKRTVILYPFLSSKGYRSGCYWLCSACYGTPLRTDCLSVAVLGILITAPLGAILIDGTYKKLLCQSKNKK